MSIQLISNTDPSTAEKILTLQKKSYEVEAEIIEFNDIPPFQDTLEKIMKSDEQFLGFVENQTVYGVLAYKEETTFIDIHRLMVDPDHFQNGIGQALLDDLFSRYPDYTITVQTGKDNMPAVNLYEKNGFEKTQEVEVEPGFSLVMYTRNKMELDKRRV
ncbi:N-acetyltransferase [Halobacillus fulvus]|nr:N-acetyltransferase [Halobacillus fulvus]